MPTRYTVSINYGSASSDVHVEVDVVYETPKEWDPKTERWRDENGRFTSPPEIKDVRDMTTRANGIKKQVAEQMRSPELQQAIKEADFNAVENGETVGSIQGEGYKNVTRIDPNGDGNEYKRYTLEQGRLEEF